MSKYICLQQDTCDCGFACIKMMLANCYRDEKYLYIIKEYYHSEYSLKDLEEIAKGYNMKTTGVFFDDINELYSRPMTIIQINLDGAKHFSIFEKANKNKVHLLDPKLGKVTLSKKEFEPLFLGYGLIYEEKGENILKEDNSFDLDNFTFIFLLFSYIIDFLLIYLGTYFLKPNSPLICEVLLVLCFTFNILAKLIYYKLYLNKVDRDEIKPLLRNAQGKKVKQNTYNMLINYKNSKIKMSSSLIGNLVIIFFIIIISFIQSIYLCLISFLILGISFLLHFIIKNKEKILMINISRLEAELQNNLTETNYDKVLSYTSKYIKNKVFNKVIVLTIVAILILIVQSICNVQSFTYFVFYFFLFQFFYDKVNEVLIYKEKKIEFDVIQNEFNSLKIYIESKQKEEL